jgi:predicted MFS family arabinose efflux permease
VNAKPTVRLRYQVLFFALVRTILNTPFRMIYPFLPAISRGLGVEISAINQAVTLRATLGALSPVVGSIGDARGRKFAMLVGISSFIGAMALVFISPTFPALVVSMLMVTLAKIMFDPAMYAYIGDVVSYDRRGLAMGIGEFGWSGAFLLGVPIVGWLIARGGWSGNANAFAAPFGLPGVVGLLPREQWAAPFPYLLLAGIAILILLWQIVPATPVQGSQRTSLVRGLRAIIASPAALGALMAGVLLSGSNEMVNIVFGRWMEDSFGLRIIALGITAAIIGVAELGGEGLTALLADRLGKRRSVAIGFVTYGLSCLLLPVLGTTYNGALVGLFLFYITFEFTLVCSIPLMSELLPSARATLLAAMASASSVGRAVGSLIGPALFTFGIGANAVTAAVLNLVALGLILWLVRESPQKPA